MIFITLLKKIKVYLTCLIVLTILGLSSTPIFAARSDYYDYGPYYSNSQVLGFSLSSLENLPAPTLPEGVSLPKAQGIMPDSPFYGFEKFAENIQLTATFDPIKREELRLSFANERLAEAGNMLASGKTEAAHQAVADYQENLNTIAANISAFPDNSSPQAQSLFDNIEKSATHELVLSQSLSLSSIPAQSENWQQISSSSQHVLDAISEVKGEPPIPEGLNVAIGSLKEQGVLSEEQSNKLYGLKTRTEVREELEKLASGNAFPPADLAKLDTRVESRYPDFHKQYENTLELAELRVYHTLPQPDEDVQDKISEWQNGPQNVPPPPEIKPYLWYQRANDLAQSVDLTNISNDQQSEVAKFYPESISDNPTYKALEELASVSPSPTDTPDENTTTDTNTTAQLPTPTAFPTVPPPDVKPYLAEVGGPLPGDPAYFFKRFGEQVTYTFTFDPLEKANRQFQMAERRLAEAAAIKDDKNKAALYSATLKEYQNSITSAGNHLENAPENQNREDIAQRFEAQAARHEAIFEKGLLPVPEDQPKLIADTIKKVEDTIDITADIEGKPALPPLLANRLEDLKAQGVILDEEVDDLVKSDSRKEVREKIRELVELGTFPLADAKKMDEAQILSAPSDYNQLVEVRKVEELQNLRTVQRDLAQTASLRAQADNLTQKETVLNQTIDPALISEEDLKGRDDLIKTYKELAKNSGKRPINLGQFGGQVTIDNPNPSPSISPPARADAELTTCPIGAVFQSGEGCVWENGNQIDDYWQYQCDGPRQYYSFVAKKCLAYEQGQGFGADSAPICPAPYTWSWETQSCQAFTGGDLPTPPAEPTPRDEKEIAERSKSCPQGSSYQPPNGCVWDDGGEPVNDGNAKRYQCDKDEYYSFESQSCVEAPDNGTYPADSMPSCKEENAVWSWAAGKCVFLPGEPLETTFAYNVPQPVFAAPGNPFYPLKQFGETLQLVTAITPENREKVKIAQAKERLVEGYFALENKNEEAFKTALADYTGRMQSIYNDLSKSNLSADAKKAIGEVLGQEAINQNLILEKAQVIASEEQSNTIAAASSTTILGVDKAADLKGEPVLPDEIKEKIESLPEDMIKEEDKKKILGMDSRVEARLEINNLLASGILTAPETAFLNEDFTTVNEGTKIKLDELKKLEEVTDAKEQKDKIDEVVENNENIVKKLDEFQKSFEVGQEVPADLRPYVRLTRIEEVARTIRPDIIKLGDFQNRKDVLLAVATLQEEFKPTRDAYDRVADFRRRNPNAALPTDLARIEALSYSLGVRQNAGPCYLPSPPFGPNTPCPAPGAAIPISSYYSSSGGYPAGTSYNPTGSFGPSSYSQPSLDKDGKPLVYGQGPKAESAGNCPDGYHWMYDSGGWCMSNGGSYGNYSSSSGPGPGGGPGYTPYSPYYNAPGVPPGSYGYQGSGTYSTFSPNYSAPSYWGTAPTNYTTNPYPGSVPGSGPAPIASGQCPSGYHWMAPSQGAPGWCMSDGGTYVPSGSTGYTPSGSINCGSQGFNTSTGRCNDGACPGGTNWDGQRCVASSTSYYSPNLTQSSCGPGYYWDGRGCIPTYNSGSYTSTGNTYSSSGSCPGGYWWNGYSCQPSGSSTGSSCTYPSGGCGGNGAWYDYSTCSCKTTSYSTGSYSSGSGSCTYPSGGCGSNSYYDWGTCSCRSNTSSGSYYSGYSSTSGSCTYPSGGCSSGQWFDYGTCSCRSSTSTTSSGGSTGSTSGSCPSGYHWMSDSGGWCMSDSGSSGGSSGSTSTSTSGSTGSSSGSCPSGYHWMSDNGGWCMSDGGSSGSTSTTTTTTTTDTSTQSSPPPSDSGSTTTTTTDTSTSSPPPPAPSP